MSFKKCLILGLLAVTSLAIVLNPVFAEKNGVGLGTNENGQGAFHVSDYCCCKDINPSATSPGYPSDPVGRGTMFLTTDNWVIGWVRFGGIADDDYTRLIWDNECPIEVTWKWYDPSKNLVQTDTYTIPKPSDYGWTAWVWYKAWSILPSSQFVTGRWELEIVAKSALGDTWFTYMHPHITTPQGVPEFPFALPAVLMIAFIAYIFASKKYQKI